MDHDIYYGPLPDTGHEAKLTVYADGTATIAIRHDDRFHFGPEIALARQPIEVPC